MGNQRLKGKWNEIVGTGMSQCVGELGLSVHIATHLNEPGSLTKSHAFCWIIVLALALALALALLTAIRHDIPSTSHQLLAIPDAWCSRPRKISPELKRIALTQAHLVGGVAHLPVSMLNME